jgi:hypothetical protein
MLIQPEHYDTVTYHTTFTIINNVVFQPNVNTVKVYGSKAETYITIGPEANKHIYAPAILFPYLLE